MASSGSADDDFQSRVSRIFGSLAFSRSSSSNLSTSSAPSSRQQSGSVWSLSDTDVEKREWKRDSYDRDEIPCATSFDELLRQQRSSSTARTPLEDDLKDIDCGEEDFDNAWSIRASMGLDRTLDNEAEEDEYDKVALGEENGGKSSSMKDILSKPSGVRIRDPRANHIAAKIRLQEDLIEASKLSSFGDQPSKSKEQPQSEESTKAVPPPKPILKRKENSSDSEAKTSKRVRFDFVSEETSKKPEDTCSASASFKNVFHKSKSGASVPDYLVNPSKYTRYSFDPSCELNKKSPTQEDMDIPKAVDGLKTSEAESSEKFSFIPPQKKTMDIIEDSSNCSETKPIVAEEVAEDERPSETEDERPSPTKDERPSPTKDERPSATEDGDSELGESESCTSFQRNGRQYRVQRSLDETDD